MNREGNKGRDIEFVGWGSTDYEEDLLATTRVGRWV